MSAKPGRNGMPSWEIAEGLRDESRHLVKLLTTVAVKGKSTSKYKGDYAQGATYGVRMYRRIIAPQQCPVVRLSHVHCSLCDDEVYSGRLRCVVRIRTKRSH